MSHKHHKHHKKYSGTITTIKSPLIKSPVTKVYKPKPPCHKITEVYDNLYLCNINQVHELVRTYEPDVIVPLDHVQGDIWNWGFNGKICYYPVPDFDILPEDVLDNLVQEVIAYLHNGKKVAIFCVGGHGRTGYIASCILGKIGIEDPIKWVREMYCSKAIECNEQVRGISDYLGKPELYTKYHMKDLYGFGRYDLGYGYGYSDYAYQTPVKKEEEDFKNFDWDKYFAERSPLGTFVPEDSDY